MVRGPQVVRQNHQQLRDARVIGWFYYEYDSSIGSKEPPTNLKMWTLSGYKELRPKPTEAQDKEKK